MLVNMNTQTTIAEMPDNEEDAQARPASDCWDPSVMDPEAMECRCMNVWHAQCQSNHGNGSSYDRCIQCKICGQDYAAVPLCKTWKDAADCKSCASLMQVQPHEASGIDAPMENLHHHAAGGLDASVQGKCGA